MGYQKNSKGKQERVIDDSSKSELTELAKNGRSWLAAEAAFWKGELQQNCHRDARFMEASMWLADLRAAWKLAAE